MSIVSKKIILTKPVLQPTLAFGGELKNTVCCAFGNKAVISEVLQNLEEKQCYDSFLNLIKELPKIVGVTPEIVVYDLHPEYISTKIAMQKDVWPKAKKVGIQHHHAHVASSLAAEGIFGENILGLAFDGTGYGTDGTMWGGEFFVGSVEKGFSRVARFRPIKLIGQAVAIKEPWRIALALAKEAGINQFKKSDKVDEQTWQIVEKLLKLPQETISSSVGRLFDGVAALMGLCTYANQEAEAAIILEKAAGTVLSENLYQMPFEKNEDELWEIDWRPMIKEISKDLVSGISKEKIAAAFHDSLAQSVFELCKKIKNEYKTSVVVASGGVFWNQRLTKKLNFLFEKNEFIVSKKVPPSDAGLSLGQAVLAK